MIDPLDPSDVTFADPGHPFHRHHMALALDEAAAAARVDEVPVGAVIIAPDRGVIASGKRADFIVLDSDPSADIEATTHIRAVWQRGVQVSGPVDAFQP